jgi:hypothetical protein
MTKFTALVIIVSLRIIYQPSYGQNDVSPFASTVALSSTTISAAPAKLINFSGSISNNKIMLNWTVGENETADRFEIEKSTDGKNFTMAALVFGTDKSETGNYQFFEKAGKQKVLYRVKLISKNQEVHYSALIEINPNT